MKIYTVYFSILGFIATVVFGSIIYSNIFIKGSQKSADSKTLRRIYNEDPDTLNLITANDTQSTAFQSLVYESLASRNFVNPDVWVPVLAESWDFDPDTLTYTIHLRDNVYWHPITLPDTKRVVEGVKFTAKDVQFTFDAILNKNVECPFLRMAYEDSEAEDPTWKYKIKYWIEDDLTFKVQWLKPYFLMHTYTLGMAIMPRHVFSVDKKGEPISLDFSGKEFANGFNNHWANTKMCGTGPMMFDSWVRDKRFSLKRWDEYWGTPYNFDRVNYIAIRNDNTVLQKIEDEEADMTGIARSVLYLKGKKSEAAKEGKVIFDDYYRPSYRYVGYNLNRPFFQDKKVRWALSHAVPVQTIIDKVWKGLARPTTGPFLPDSSSTDQSLKPIQFSLTKARQLLDEAGWIDTDDDGIRDKVIDGVKYDASYELLIFAGAPDYEVLARFIQENNRKIGVEVSIEPTKWALMLDKMNKRTFDAVILGWMMSWTSDPKQIWHSDYAHEPNSSNHISYESEKVDALIDELQTTVLEKDQVKIFQEIHREIYEDQPYTFLFQEKGKAAYNARIHNVKFYAMRPCSWSGQWYVGDTPPPTMPLEVIPPTKEETERGYLNETPTEEQQIEAGALPVKEPVASDQ